MSERRSFWRSLGEVLDGCFGLACLTELIVWVGAAAIGVAASIGAYRWTFGVLAAIALAFVISAWTQQRRNPRAGDTGDD